LGYRLSKHKMTILSKNFGRALPPQDTPMTTVGNDENHGFANVQHDFIYINSCWASSSFAENVGNIESWSRAPA